jgi:uroporphyrinogen-III decarboxylase
MFSDILTPLTGMNVPFDILEKEGPVVSNPVRQNTQDAEQMPRHRSRHPRADACDALRRSAAWRT